jgi:hypothetical protein
MHAVMGHQAQFAGSNPVDGIDVCVWFYIVYVSKRGFAVGQFLIEGFLSDI